MGNPCPTWYLTQLTGKRQNQDDQHSLEMPRPLPAPHVLTVLLVAHAQDDFRCPVVPRHHVGGHHEVGARCPCQAEVQDLQGAVWLDNDVARFQVLGQKWFKWIKWIKARKQSTSRGHRPRGFWLLKCLMVLPGGGKWEQNPDLWEQFGKTLLSNWNEKRTPKEVRWYPSPPCGNLIYLCLKPCEVELAGLRAQGP